ncbi:MAG: hypothetical protein V9E87_11350 [Gemmatimonadales bacterium]
MLLLLVSACGRPANAAACRGPQRTALPSRGSRCSEAWQTVRDTLMDIDSPAIWHGPNGEAWLLVSAKAGNLIRVHEAATGKWLRDVGTARDAGRGSSSGRMASRCAGDLLVGRRARRSARAGTAAVRSSRRSAAYGERDLMKPYGVTIADQGAGRYRSWITDSYELVKDSVPPDSALGRRVREYQVVVERGRATATLAAHLRGYVTAPGVLRVVESIMADPANDQLLIAEELEGASQLKRYTLAGRFTGDTVPRRFFPNQAEGIVLYACGDSAGYWVATDQGKVINTYHLFDRKTLAHVGAFGSPTIKNTDGIALTQRALPGFPAGRPLRGA